MERKLNRTILVPLDGSKAAERALPKAVSLARASGARLALVRAAWAHVLPGIDPTNAQIKVMKQAEAYLAGIVADLAKQGVVAESYAIYDSPVEAILMEIDIHQADQVVMSTHARTGVGRWLAGSIAEAVVRRSPVPVLLVRPGDAETTAHSPKRGKPNEVQVFAAK